METRMHHDEISNPKHYDLFPGMQAIDVIEAALTPDEFAGYLKGNALKYKLRAGDKGPAEKCIGKAEWYRERLLEHHDFMNSEAITRAEHAKLKAEDEAIKAAQFPSTGVFGPMEGEWLDQPPREAVGADVAFPGERGLYFAATPGEMEDGAGVG